MEKSNNEIGIIELSAKAINLIKKYFILIICFLFAGLILGFVNYKNTSISYKKKLIFCSNYIPYPILNSFTYDLAQNNYKTKNEIFNINTIAKIEQSFLDTLLQKGKLYLQISFILNDTNNTSNIFNQYFTYLDSIPYIKIAKERNKVKNMLILDKIKIKLEELEIQQNRVKLSKNEIPIITGDSYKEYIDLYCLKLDYEEKVKNDYCFQKIYESNSISKPNSSRLFNSFKFGLAFLLTSFLIIFIIEFAKKIKSIRK